MSDSPVSRAPDSATGRTAGGESLVTPDQVFAQLDGQPISLAGVRRQVEVYSVHDEAGFRWIQLALTGPAGEFQMVTVKLRAGQGAQHAFLSLSSWLVNPDLPHRDILNVA